MPGTEPSILAAIVASLEPYFVAQGLDFSRLAAEAGIARKSLAHPDNFVSLTSLTVLLETAARRAGDPCFGLHCAEAFPIGPVSVLGHIMLNAPTTLDALSALRRFMRLIMAPVDTSCREEDGLLHWSRNYPSDFEAPRLQFDLFSTALIIRRLRQGAGPDWHLEAVQFDHADPGCAQDCARLLAPKILYNQPQMALVLDLKELHRHLKGADHQLYDILRRHAEMLLLAQPDRKDIVALTRHQIECLLADGNAKLEKVAKELKMSPRTLRARLSKKNKTFTSLLDEVRERKARYYLRATDMQITEVAFLLGFSELSAFTHAATHWLGMSPRAYRAAQRRQLENANGGQDA